MQTHPDIIISRIKDKIKNAAKESLIICAYKIKYKRKKSRREANVMPITNDVCASEQKEEGGISREQ